MTIKYYRELVQGSEEWFQTRCGLLTASEMDRIISPKKLEYSNSEKERSHLYELLAQRATGYVEPQYKSDAMLRGADDEIRAKALYNEHYGALDDCGFITNDKWGFTLGYSPDALIRGGGQVEVKSRAQKYQIETIINYAMPDDFRIQMQTGLLVSEEPFCEFITYCGGMRMLTLRIEPDIAVQSAILCAASQFHDKMEKMMAVYLSRLDDPKARFIETERTIEEEITL